MDNWDPMTYDFYRRDFNSYDQGPGKSLQKILDRGPAPGPVTLFITGIPREVTEEGMRNLFIQAGNVLRVNKPPPKQENFETCFGFVTMGSVKEAENAIRMFNGFNLERFSLRVKVALTEEEKKQKQQQKKEEEEFFNQLQSFHGKPKTPAVSDSEKDPEKKKPAVKPSENIPNGLSEEPGGKPVVGKGRGKVLEELTGLYRTTGRAACLQKLVSPRQQDKHGYAVGPGGAADDEKQNQQGNHEDKETLNDRFQEKFTHPKKLSPGDSYNVENLTITVKDPCDQSQHSVTKKGEEIKLKHAANQPNQLKKILSSTEKGLSMKKGIGRGQFREGLGRGGGQRQHGEGIGRGRFDSSFQQGGYRDQNTGPGRYGGGYHDNRERGRYGEPMGRGRHNDSMARDSYGMFPGGGGYGPAMRPGGYGRGNPFPGQGGYHPAQRGFERYDNYMNGYGSGFDAQNMPGPKNYGAYGPNQPSMGLLGHRPAGFMPQDPYRGYPSQAGMMGPYGGDPYLLTPVPTLLNMSMPPPAFPPNMNNSAMNSTTLNTTTRNVDSRLQSPAISTTAEDKPEEQHCSVCAKIGQSRCSSCKTPYCSRKCQTDDWPQHKKLCKSIKKEREEAEDFERNFDVTVGDDMIENMKGLVEKFTGEEVEVTRKPEATKSPSQATQKAKPQTATISVHTRDDEKGNQRNSSGEQNRGQDRTRQDRNDRRGTSTNSKNTCHNCKKPGHFSRECPDKLEALKNTTCYNCRQKGHYKGECPETGKSRDEPAPVKLDKPLAQSTPDYSRSNTQSKPPSQSVNTTPTKHTAQPLIKDTGKKGKDFCLPTATLPLNKEVMVVVTEIESPDKIWVQVVDPKNVEPLQELMMKMAQKFNNSKPDLSTGQNFTGVYCGVQFSLDKQWYRGKVINKPDWQTYNVQFVDFGNGELKKSDELRPLDEDMLQHPAQAIHCYIEDISPPGSQTIFDTPMEKLQSIIPSDAAIKTVVKTQKEGEFGSIKYGVHMFNEGGESIADKLIAAGLAKMKTPAPRTPEPKQQADDKSVVIMKKELGCLSKEMKAGQEIYIMITDADSPANFTVHLMEEERIASFKSFSEKLKNVEKDVPYMPSNVGELVVAQFSADGSWYRGEVLKLLEKQVEINYIDFGNSETVEFTNVRKPKPFCKTLPAQALKCCLSGFEQPKNEDVAKQVLIAFVELVSLAMPVKLRSVVKSIKDDIVMLEVFSAQENKSVNSELSTLYYVDKETKTVASVEKVSSELGPVKDIPPGKVPLDATVSAIVIEIYDNESFYVQVLDDSLKSQLEQLMMDLNQFCNSNAVAVSGELEVGQFVAAKFTDGVWYRAKVTEPVITDKVSVLYVDFGNSETVSKDMLKTLDPSFAVVPTMAVHCKLLGSQGNDKQITEDFKSVLNQTLHVKAKGKQHGVYVVELLLPDTDGGSVNTILGLDINKVQGNVVEPPQPSSKDINKVQGNAVDASVDKVVSELGPVKDIPQGKVPLDATVPAIVIEIYDNESFYVQVLDDSLKSQLEQLMMDLNQFCNSNAVAVSGELEVGQFVAAKFTDGVWYRAKVTEPVITDKVSVLYVDFGNSETVSKDMLKTLDPSFAVVPTMAVHCKLLGSQGYDKQITEDFKSVLNQTLHVKAKGKQHGVYVVELLLPDTDAGSVNTILGLDINKVQGNVVEPPQPSSKDINKVQGNAVDASVDKVVSELGPVKDIPQGKVPLDASVQAIVIEIYNNESFYVQVLDDSLKSQLEQLMMDLNQFCNSNAVAVSGELEVGQFVAAKFTDGVWYRAKVTEPVITDKVSVLYVDFGNSETVSKDMLKTLDPSFAVVPTMAVHCKLLGSQGYDKQITEDFKNVLNQTLHVKAKGKQHGVYVVELLLPDTDAGSVNTILGLDINKVQGNVVEPPLPSSEDINKEQSQPPSKEKVSVTVIPTLPLPLDGNKLAASVIDVQRLDHFFIQLSDEKYKLELASLMGELNQNCARDNKPYEPKEGENIAAQFNDGESVLWYRALSLGQDPTSSNKFQVLFVDYGNKEVLTKEMIRVLEAQFTELPAMAVKCKLRGSTGIESAEKIEEFKAVMHESVPLKVRAISLNMNVYEVEMFLDSDHVEKTNISEILELGQQTTQHQTPSTEVPSPKTKVISEPKVSESTTGKPGACAKKGLECIKLPMDRSPVPAAVMAVESFQCFTVQILSTEIQELLAAMMIELNEYCTSAVKPYNPVVGEVVAAQYTDNGCVLWYRARVNQVLGEKYQVTFVDYGNTELVEKKQICQISDTFLELPQVTVKCKLEGCTGIEDPQDIKAFEQLNKCQFLLKASICTNDVYTIELLTNDGISINEELWGTSSGGSKESPTPVTVKMPEMDSRSPKQEALPRKSLSPQLSPASERKVVFAQTLPRHTPTVKEFKMMITSITSPAVFHSQMINPEHDYQTDLALQTHQMMLECESELGQDDAHFEVGELCCAKYELDNSWYRASILKLYPDKTAQVEFVDFGNTELVPLSMIRPITNDYVELPILAFKCCLSGVYPIAESWTNDASDKLKLFLNKLLIGTLVNVHKDVYEVKLTEPESKADVGEALVHAGVARDSARAASSPKAAESQATASAQPEGETERLQKENEVMRQQLLAMQAQMAELLKQKK